jgi:hypothetical protein
VAGRPVHDGDHAVDGRLQGGHPAHASREALHDLPDRGGGRSRRQHVPRAGGADRRGAAPRQLPWERHATPYRPAREPCHHLRLRPLRESRRRRDRRGAHAPGDRRAGPRQGAGARTPRRGLRDRDRARRRRARARRSRAGALPGGRNVVRRGQRLHHPRRARTQSAHPHPRARGVRLGGAPTAPGGGRPGALDLSRRRPAHGRVDPAPLGRRLPGDLEPPPGGGGLRRGDAHPRAALRVRSPSSPGGTPRRAGSRG